MTETTTATPLTSESPGFFRMIWGVLAKPRATFATLRSSQSRAWMLMAVLCLILVTLPLIARGAVTSQQSREQIQEQLQNQPGFAEGSGDVEQAVSLATSPILTIVLPAIGSVIGRILGWLLWSGALYLLASMVGGRSNFLQVLKVVIWAWLPFALRSIVQAIYMMATQAPIANQGLSGFAGMPVIDASNPFAIEMPSTGTAVLYAFLGQIDIYLFWYLALLVLGITAVTKLSGRKSAGLVLVVWVVFMAIRLIGTAVTNSLTSGMLGG